MSSSKDFMHNQLKKWKDAANQFIGHDQDGTREMPDDAITAVELQPEYYEKCRQLAEAQNTSVSAVVHYLLKQQLLLRGQERIAKVNSLQIENNPLLALDGLTGRRQSRDAETEVEIDEFA